MRRLLDKPAIAISGLLLLELIALFNALPHLRDSLWQDEVVTLLYSSAQGIAHPFQVYFSPNNHPLFSALMAVWIGLFPEGVSVPLLRALPIGAYLLAVLITWLAGRRLGGPLCGFIAAALFATSPVAAGFAAQLRGYGPSWLFLALALWCALNCERERAGAWLAGHAVASAAAVAILPSNLVLALAIAAGVLAGRWLPPRRSDSALSRWHLLMLCSPLLGLLAYAAVFDDLLRFADMDLSSWSRGALLREWLRAPFADIAWIWIPVGAGAVAGAYALWRARRLPEEAIPQGLGTAFGLLAAFFVAVLAMPKVPFPRTLVPFLPVWFCVLACFTAYGVEHAWRQPWRGPALAGALAVAVTLFALQPQPPCRDSGPTPAGDGYDLCYQFFHDRYHPEAVADAWTLLRSPQLPVVSDYEGYYALRVLDVPGLQVHEYRSLPQGSETPAIITAHPGDLERITAAIGAEARDYRLVANTGYFKLYARPLH